MRLPDSVMQRSVSVARRSVAPCGGGRAITDTYLASWLEQDATQPVSRASNARSAGRWMRTPRSAARRASFRSARSRVISPQGRCAMARSMNFWSSGSLQRRSQSGGSGVSSTLRSHSATTVAGSMGQRSPSPRPSTWASSSRMDPQASHWRPSPASNDRQAKTGGVPKDEQIEHDVGVDHDAGAGAHSGRKWKLGAGGQVRCERSRLATPGWPEYNRGLFGRFCYRSLSAWSGFPNELSAGYE